MIVATAMVQLAVEHQYIGLVTALAVAARNIGGAVGQVIYISIFTGRLKQNIITYVAGPLIKAGVSRANVEGIVLALESSDTGKLADQLTPTQLEIAIKGSQQAITSSLRIVYLSSIAFGVVGTIFVCFCQDVDHLLTSDVDIQLDEGAMIQAVTDTGGGHFISVEEQMQHTNIWRRGNPTVTQAARSTAHVDG